MVYTPRSYLIPAAVALVALQMQQAAATSLFYDPYTSADTTDEISSKFPARGADVSDKDCAITVEVDPTLPDIATISTVTVTYTDLLANTSTAPTESVSTKVGTVIYSVDTPAASANQDAYTITTTTSTSTSSSTTSTTQTSTTSSGNGTKTSTKTGTTVSQTSTSTSTTTSTTTGKKGVEATTTAPATTAPATTSSSVGGSSEEEATSSSNCVAKSVGRALGNTLSHFGWHIVEQFFQTFLVIVARAAESLDVEEKPLVGDMVHHFLSDIEA
ncbi:hypothetical protein ON010_g850 [Phytophthora cinnamomi]|nr:hypothetical protein ON010_g850 [Phytophthora cinnamomi]